MWSYWLLSKQWQGTAWLCSDARKQCINSIDVDQGWHWRGKSCSPCLQSREGNKTLHRFNQRQMSLRGTSMSFVSTFRSRQVFQVQFWKLCLDGLPLCITLHQLTIHKHIRKWHFIGQLSICTATGQIFSNNGQGSLLSTTLSVHHRTCKAENGGTLGSRFSQRRLV